MFIQKSKKEIKNVELNEIHLKRIVDTATQGMETSRVHGGSDANVRSIETEIEIEIKKKCVYRERKRWFPKAVTVPTPKEYNIIINPIPTPRLYNCARTIIILIRIYIDRPHKGISHHPLKEQMGPPRAH